MCSTAAVSTSRPVPSAARRNASTARSVTCASAAPSAARSPSSRRCSSAWPIWRPSSKPRGCCSGRPPPRWTPRRRTRRRRPPWPSATPRTRDSGSSTRPCSSMAATAICATTRSSAISGISACTRSSKARTRSCASSSRASCSGAEEPGVEDILYERRGRAAVVTLNRPDTLNAISLDMVRRLDAILDEAEADPAVAHVVVQAAGERAFAAGGDIRALYEWGREGRPELFGFFREEYRLNARIKRFPKPYVAVIHGIVMGGGAGISIHGSHRVVTERVAFAMPEVGIGFVPDIGGSHFLGLTPGRTGLYLGLTGTRVGAADMLWAGLATHVVAHDRREEAVQALAEAGSLDAAL